MNYLKWTDDDISGLRRCTGVDQIWTESDDGGRVLREVGFDALGKVIHVFDGRTRDGGFFDGATLETSGLTDDLAKASFEEMWEVGFETLSKGPGTPHQR